MKLKDISFEDLEAMSYDDIALLVLKEKNKGLKINELFKEVCKLLKLSDAFFDVISTDGRFTMLENGLWDLKTKHSTKVVIDNEDEEEEITDEIDEDEEEEEEEEEENFYDEETDDDEPEDDLKDLVIIDEDEASEIS